MKLYIRLQQILNDSGYTVADIVREYGKDNEGKDVVSEYKVKHLMDDNAKELSRDVLEKVCNFLVKYNVAVPTDLPDILFAHSPEHFWSLLYERRHVTLCMGTRPDTDYKDHVVVAADSMLQASLLKRMTEAGFQISSGNDTQHGKGRQKKYSVQIIDPQLVRAWRKAEDAPWSEKVRFEAEECYDKFLRQSEKNTALICLGSIKSNAVIDKVFETSFINATAFQSQDDCDDTRQRSCPFLIAYRKDDPKPASICGGVKLFNQAQPAEDGIYYEDASGCWTRVAWRRDIEEDAQGQPIVKGEEPALVFYRFERGISRLQVVMGGFSGQGTRCLADYMRAHQLEIEKLWPPTISNKHLDVGAFILSFPVEGMPRGDDGMPGKYRIVSDPAVFRIPKEALEHRLATVA